MNDKDLNKLDGDSMYQEVVAEKIEKNRKLYKNAIKNAVIRNDNAVASAKKQASRALKTGTVLQELVDGGMEGFIAKEEADEDDDDSGGESFSTAMANMRAHRRINRPSNMYAHTKTPGRFINKDKW